MMVRVILVLLLPLNLFSQSFYAAPLQGMGNTGLAYANLYAFDHNAAVLPFLQSLEAGIAYQPHFLSNEIRSQALYLAARIPRGGIGLALQNYGIPEVSSINQISAAYSRSFGPKFASAIAINYHGFHVKNVISEQSYSLDLGFYYKLVNEFAVGAVWKNISGVNYSDLIDRSIDSRAGLGARYTFSSDVSVASDLLYSRLQGLLYRVGVDYTMGKLVHFRTGLDTNPMILTAGIGIIVKDWRVDLSTTYHRRLGTAPQIALAYAF